MLMRNQSHFTAEIVETEPMYREKSWMTKKGVETSGKRRTRMVSMSFFFGV